MKQAHSRIVHLLRAGAYIRRPDGCSTMYSVAMPHAPAWKSITRVNQKTVREMVALGILDRDHKLVERRAQHSVQADSGTANPVAEEPERSHRRPHAHDGGQGHR